MTLEIIKKKVQAELDVCDKIGDVKIYNFLRDEILDGDTSKADEFMLSDHGGYTMGELNAIKFRSQYLNIKNKQRSFVPGRAF